MSDVTGIHYKSFWVERQMNGSVTETPLEDLALTRDGDYVECMLESHYSGRQAFYVGRVPMRFLEETNLSIPDEVCAPAYGLERLACHITADSTKVMQIVITKTMGDGTKLGPSKLMVDFNKDLDPLPRPFLRMLTMVNSRISDIAWFIHDGQHAQTENSGLTAGKPSPAPLGLRKQLI